MAIKYVHATNVLNQGKYVVLSTGGVIKPDQSRFWFGTLTPELICDTAEEAERMRLLIERRREEVEAVERKYELLIAAEVSV